MPNGLPAQRGFSLHPRCGRPTPLLMTLTNFMKERRVRWPCQGLGTKRLSGRNCSPWEGGGGQQHSHEIREITGLRFRSWVCRVYTATRGQGSATVLGKMLLRKDVFLAVLATATTVPPVQMTEEREPAPKLAGGNGTNGTRQSGTGSVCRRTITSTRVKAAAAKTW